MRKSLHSVLTGAAFSSIAVLGLASCVPDLSGILAARGTGDLLAPPVERGDALAVFREACGEPGTPSDALRRHPYVQSVRADEATLMWTSTAAAAETVSLSSGRGSQRAIPGEHEPTHYLRDARQHVARLTGLQPDTIYCYELRGATGERVFGPRGFRTAPSPTDVGARVNLVALGDSGGGGEDQRAVEAQMRTVRADLMLHVGDLAYDDANLDELEGRHFAIYQELASTVPLFPSIGDHDQATDHAGPYREVFALPRNAGAVDAERYYSFDWGPVHVLVLDAIGRGAAQLAFADRDLATTDRPWKIVISHEPPYSSGFHGSSVAMRRDYAPLFERHGVQLVLSGDDHDYERSVPIAGVTYVVTGGGGKSVRPVGRSDWTAFSQTAFHFVHVEVDGEVMRVRAIDATGREFDGVEIPRDVHALRAGLSSAR